MSSSAKILLGSIAVLALGVFGLMLARAPTTAPVAVIGTETNVKTNVSTSDKKYCQADGTLGSTKSIQSHRSYCITSNASDTAFFVNKPNALKFSIVDDEGNTLKDFQTVHTRNMHFIVVRKDLNNFQHLHTDFNAQTGEFSLSDLTFPAAGEYRLFADFTPTGSQMGPDGMPLGVTVFQDVRVGDMSQYTPQPIGDSTNSKAFDGITITLTSNPAKIVSGAEATMTFDIKNGGKPVVDLEQYLGALGHSVVLREGSLDFIHAHPTEKTAQTGKVDFGVYFPESGKYKIFTQFQRGGTVITTDFVVTVLSGTSAAGPNTPPAGHSMMIQ